jgi:hypothetical protein
MGQEDYVDDSPIGAYMEAHGEDTDAADRLIMVEKMLSGNVEDESRVDKKMVEIEGILRDLILVTMNVSSQLETTSNLIKDYIQNSDELEEGIITPQ